MKRLYSVLSVLAFFLFVISCNHNPPKNSLEAQAELGKVHFQMHCMGCHGPDGKGGTMLSQDVQPADLTTIQARRSVDEFPVMEIARLIDGRNRVEAHGTTTMPIWGEVFTSGEMMNEDAIEGKMEEIIAYLITIQTER